MLGKFFNRFFKHSNGSAWWSKAKISFIASFILNLVITIYGLIQKTLAVNVILTLLIGTAIIYIQTLTASCLKTSKCSILAWLQLLGVICYILFAGYVVANRFVINLDVAGSSVSLKDQYKVEAFGTPRLKLVLFPGKDYKVSATKKVAKLFLPANMGGKKFTKKQIEDAGIKTEDITSIKKSDNIVMVLYNSDNLTGERSVYYDNKNNFQTLSSGKWYKKIDSIHIFRKSFFEKYSKDPATIFYGKDYTSNSMRLWVLPNEQSATFSKDEIKFHGINEKTVTSILNHGKWTTTGYDNSNMTGRSKTITKNVLKLSSENDNKFKSFKVERKSNNKKYGN